LAAAISPGNSLSLELQNQIESNDAGTMWILLPVKLNSPFPSRDFVLATVRFQSHATNF
jgi:hypothetical protein